MKVYKKVVTVLVRTYDKVSHIDYSEEEYCKFKNKTEVYEDVKRRLGDEWYIVAIDDFFIPVGELAGDVLVRKSES